MKLKDLAPKFNAATIDRTLSSLLSAQYADDRAENTEPRSLRLHVPIRSADSNTTTAAAYCPAPSNSWPTTEIITKGDLSSFITSSW